MKNSYRIIFILIILNRCMFGQITFEKYHAEIDKILSIDETPDQGFILSTLEKLIVKLDKHGDIEWTKQYQSLNTNSHDVISCSDSSLVFVTSYEGEKIDVFLRKLTMNGDLIWTRKYGTADDDYGKYVRELPDKGFLIFGTQIIKTDKNGVIEWQKKNPVTLSFNNSILINNDGKIFISAAGWLSCLNAEGELLWSVKFKLGNYSLIKLNDHLYFSGTKNIHKIDLNGNLVWSKPLSDYYSIAEYDSENFIIASQDTMMKLSPDLDTVWVKKIINKTFPNTIKKTTDKGYILTGNYGWILKTDENGDHKSVLIQSPELNEIVNPGIYNVKWTSLDVHSVSLDYSKDKGITWNSIVKNVTGSDSAEWEVSEYGDYLLRIYDDADRDIIDYAGPFRVHWNHKNDYIGVNKIKMWVSNNGMGSHNEITDGSGLYWNDKDSSEIGSVFRDGLQWGGRVNGVVNANGNYYRNGLVPGKINNDGSGDDRNSFRYSIWKINKQWEMLPEGDKKEQYKLNYLNWPGELGAPFVDVDKNGVFSAGTDLPQFTGDEVLWFVSNDTDSLVSSSVYGCNPIGLEVQTTVYGFNRNDDLRDVVFKKYTLINKGSNKINDMFLSYWSDPDFGFAGDDCVGCDTLLDLGYCYNGDNNDDYNFGENPPAMGYKIVQGPVVNSPGESAIFKGEIVPDKKNLKMSSFIGITKSVLLFPDITMGSINGAVQLYNYQNGKKYDGTDIADPISGQITEYVLPGDPAAGTGWYEGPGWPGGPAPDDRRLILSTGSFNFAPGDTQEVVFAIIFARGSDNLNSVTELKKRAERVQQFYGTGTFTNADMSSRKVYNYELSQNYPNPFNPSTIIRFSVPERTKVELKVFDILGKQAKVLINEELNPGNHQVRFNAQNLSSGIYYYQLKTKNYISTKKMILIK